MSKVPLPSTWFVLEFWGTHTSAVLPHCLPPASPTSIVDLNDCGALLWWLGEGGERGSRVMTSYLGHRLRRPALGCRSSLMWKFTSTYTHIIQSVKDTLHYYPMRPNGVQPTSCEGVHEGQHVLVVCLWIKDGKQAMPCAQCHSVGLRCAWTPLCVFWYTRDSSLLEQLQIPFVLLTFPVFLLESQLDRDYSLKQLHEEPFGDRGQNTKGSTHLTEIRVDYTPHRRKKSLLNQMEFFLKWVPWAYL